MQPFCLPAWTEAQSVATMPMSMTMAVSMVVMVPMVMVPMMVMVMIMCQGLAYHRPDGARRDGCCDADPAPSRLK